MNKMSSDESLQNPDAREQAKKDFMLVKECDMLSASYDDEGKSKTSSYIRNNMKKHGDHIQYVEEMGDRVEAVNGKLVTTTKKVRPQFNLNLEELGINATNPKDFNHRISHTNRTGESETMRGNQKPSSNGVDPITVPSADTYRQMSSQRIHEFNEINSTLPMKLNTPQQE